MSNPNPHYHRKKKSSSADLRLCTSSWTLFFLHNLVLDIETFHYGIMCGIHVAIATSAPGQISANLERCLCSRGPDHISTHEACLSNGDGGASTTHLAFTSTVLALRGDHVARQPFVDPDSGSVFCWNGEAWKVRHHDVAGNDGEAIASLLNEAVRASSAHDREHGVLKLLRSIDGPFAFVFFDKPSNRIYFGRDRLGRRSLLIQASDERLVLSSIADVADKTWKEVEADGVYVLELDEEKAGCRPNEPFTLISRRDWLEGEDAASFVSLPLQKGSLRSSSAMKFPSSLPFPGLRDWEVQ